MHMLFLTPPIIRVFSKLFATKPDVYVYNVAGYKGGKLLLLFRRPLSQEIQTELVNQLSALGELVRSNMAVGTHTVSVEWKPLVESRVGAVYVTGEIQLTVFKTALGTYEPRLERWQMSPSEASLHILDLSRKHDINWAGELRLRSA